MKGWNIWESVRTFGERFKEHSRVLSHIHDHASTSGPHAKLKNFSTVGRESHGTTRTIKEAMLMRVNDPFLNRNIGNFKLPHNTPVLCLKQILLPYNQAHCARPHHPAKQDRWNLPTVSTALCVVGMGSHSTTHWCHTPWYQSPFFASVLWPSMRGINFGMY